MQRKTKLMFIEKQDLLETTFVEEGSLEEDVQHLQFLLIY